MKSKITLLITMFLLCSLLPTSAQICGVQSSYSYGVSSGSATFTNQSNADSAWTITDQVWSFGDGSSSVLANPTHTYINSGTYQVCLLVSGESNAETCIDTACQNVSITFNNCGVHSGFSYAVNALNTTFTDLSYQDTMWTLTSRIWDFGDGAASVQINPSHSYLNPGTYSVCLIITGQRSNGQVCADTVCQTVNIAPNCGLHPEFSYAVNQARVTFTNQAQPDPGWVVTSSIWNFGDGTIASTQSNVSHNYASPGTYEVCLFQGGRHSSGQICLDTFCLNVIVTASDCGVNSQFSYAVTSMSASFTNQSTSDLNWTITSRDWNFGDGSSSVTTDPTHTYTNAGTYQVCLVTNGQESTGQSCSDTLCNTVNITSNNCGVHSNFSHSVNLLTTAFTNHTSLDTGWTITNRTWYFGDGSSSTQLNPTRIYPAIGSYQVCLISRGQKSTGELCNDTVCQTVNITAAVCGANSNFVYVVNSMTANFTGRAFLDPNWTLVRRSWNFGDGTGSSLSYPSHTYTSPGTYEVCYSLTARDVNGETCADTFCANVNITFNNCGIHSNFAYGVNGTTASFLDLSSADTLWSITSKAWDFGDGGMSSQPNPSHTYINSGTYRVCMAVAGQKSTGQTCIDTVCQNMVITNSNCGVNGAFTYAVNSTTAAFSNNSSADSLWTITNYAWNFGDGGASASSNPNHVFINSGTYTVCLYVTGQDGSGNMCSDTICQNVSITANCGMHADYSYSIASATASYNDLSTVDSGWTITGRNWRFGDGTTSTQSNPLHTYTNAGIYEVCLMVTGQKSNGQVCMDTFCQNITIDLAACGIHSMFTYLLNDMTVSFNSLTLADSSWTINSSVWSFGDGSISPLTNPSHTYPNVGTFNVCLVASGQETNGQTCIDTICQSVNITSGSCGAHSNFTYLQNGTTASFNSVASADSGWVISNHAWNFGDGGMSAQVNPAHAYTNGGTYQVCLITTAQQDSLQICSDTVCQSITVIPNICGVSSGFTFAVNAQDVIFTSTASIDTNWVITARKWTFGDGGTSLLSNPAHRYTPGTYNICFIVYAQSNTGQNCNDTVCQTVTLTQTPCGVHANFLYSVDSMTGAFINQESVDSAWTLTSRLWKFGDGGISGVASPYHLYANEGNYQVCLIVGGQLTNGETCQDTSCQFVNVVADSCGVNADFSFAFSGNSATFSNQTSVDSFWTDVNYDWNFGDGGFSTQANPVYAYANAATYQVCLIISAQKNGQICRDTICKNITILPIGIQEVSVDYRVMIVPHPVNSYAEIIYTSILQEFSLVVLDMTGRILKEQTTQNGRLKFARETLTEGIYVYQIIQQGQTVNTGKLVIQ